MGLGSLQNMRSSRRFLSNGESWSPKSRNSLIAHCLGSRSWGGASFDGPVDRFWRGSPNSGSVDSCTSIPGEMHRWSLQIACALVHAKCVCVCALTP